MIYCSLITCGKTMQIKINSKEFLEGINTEITSQLDHMFLTGTCEPLHKIIFHILTLKS